MAPSDSLTLTFVHVFSPGVQVLLSSTLPWSAMTTTTQPVVGQSSELFSIMSQCVYDPEPPRFTISLNGTYFSTPVINTASDTHRENFWPLWEDGSTAELLKWER